MTAFFQQIIAGRREKIAQIRYFGNYGRELTRFQPEFDVIVGIDKIEPAIHDMISGFFHEPLESLDGYTRVA